jgi:hypothetical protein
LLSVLRRYRVSSQAGRYGVEKKDPERGSWDRVAMSYILKEDDIVRVCFPKQAKAGQALGAMLTKLLSGAKRRPKRGNSRNRLRRK